MTRTRARMSVQPGHGGPALVREAAVGEAVGEAVGPAVGEAVGPADGAATDGLRERKRAHNRAATIDIALALFAEHGYTDVTVADICAAAQIAPRTFFRYFASKEDLLAEPAREMTARLSDAIDAAAPDTADEEVLRLAFRELSVYAVAHRQRLATFVTVVRAASVLRSSPLLALAERERDLAEHLVRRRSAPSPPDWQTRLLVARAVAAYRVWFDDLLAADPADPLAHLDQIFGYR